MSSYLEKLEEMSQTEKARQKEARANLIAHRDKHLSQFMEINGKGSFAVLATIFAVFVGASRLDAMLIPLLAWVFVGIGVICAILLLATAAKRLSEFHTTRIRNLQRRLMMDELDVEPDDYEVIPPSSSRVNVFVFTGLVILAVVAMAISISQAALSAGQKASKAPATSVVQLIGCNPDIGARQ